MTRSTNSDGTTARRVLIVDDERLVREMVGLLLSARGAEVTAVDGGEAALEVLQRTTFDVIVVDKNMPGIDGIELIHRIRQSDGHQPAIAMLTGDAIDASRHAALAAGADLFATKPPTQAELDAMVELRR